MYTPNLEDALKMLREVTVSSLLVVGVYGAVTRADKQGSLVVGLRDSIGGSLYQVDLGTAHTARSCPENLLSLSKMLNIGSVLCCSKGGCWLEIPPRFQSHGEKVRIPSKRVGDLLELELDKVALDTGVDLNKSNVHSLFTAEVNPGSEAHGEWGPTDFSDPQFHSCAVMLEGMIPMGRCTHGH